MMAKEARKITEESVSRTLVEPLLKEAYRLIEESARQGHCSIVNPFMYLYPSPEKNVVDVALEHLKSIGYKVVEIKNSWEISW